MSFNNEGRSAKTFSTLLNSLTTENAKDSLITKRELRFHHLSQLGVTVFPSSTHTHLLAHQSIDEQDIQQEQFPNLAL